MTNPSVFRGDIHISGNLGMGSLTVPANSISDAAITGRITATKLEHQHGVLYEQANGADVASETKMIHLARGAGTIVAVAIRPDTAPTGGDKQFTVDIQKAADGSGTWATILSSAVTIDNTSVDDTVVAGTISTTTYSADDAFRAVITASGSTGSQGDGVVVKLWLREQPEP